MSVPDEEVERRMALLSRRTPYPHPNVDFEQAGVLYGTVMTDEDRASATAG